MFILQVTLEVLFGVVFLATTLVLAFVAPLFSLFSLFLKSLLSFAVEVKG
jgi:hypothetical protein